MAFRGYGVLSTLMTTPTIFGHFLIGQLCYNSRSALHSALSNLSLAKTEPQNSPHSMDPHIHSAIIKGVYPLKHPQTPRLQDPIKIQGTPGGEVEHALRQKRVFTASNHSPLSRSFVRLRLPFFHRSMRHVGRIPRRIQTEDNKRHALG